MPSSRARANRWFWLVASVYSVAFLLGSRLVTGWGKWYSEKVVYHQQAEAFLRGSFALANNPTALKNDYAWYNGGVQQVWGLGVPAWLLPFDLIAKIFDQSIFPDRLAFGIALALVAFILLYVLFPTSQKNPFNEIGQNPLRLSVSLVCLMFPPFVTICYFHFDVYEEAVAYAYLYGIGLFFLLLKFSHAPRISHYYLIAFLAGFAPFIRPTLAASGVATMFFLWCKSREFKFRFGQSVLGICTFSAGFALLFWTNQVRFGSAFEFGHSLNLNGFPVWFFDRIENPFQKEPLFSAAKELFGSVFCSWNLNGNRWDMAHFFWGQSNTPRWRDFYFRCFDLSYLALVFASWSVGSLGLLRGRGSLFRPNDSQLAIYWSIMVSGMLAAFYLRVPVSSSRYVFDFAPGFAIAITGAILGLERFYRDNKRKCFLVASFVLLAAIAWLNFELFSARSTAISTPPVRKAEALTLIERRVTAPKPLPERYAAGDDIENYGIRYNGTGWATDGHMQAMAVFFIKDPECLQITFASTPELADMDYSNVKAKVGLEFLALESIQTNGSNCVIRFSAPKHILYQKGIQVLFLAYIDQKHITSVETPLILKSVTWK